MSRPLLITDCDEVLLHMVRHFGTWLGEAKGMDFAIPHGDFDQRITRRGPGGPVTSEEMWGLLGDFFPAEMHRQTLVPHAAEALARLGQGADIVILTNLADECRQPRFEQLAAFGIRHRVECNHGGKGRAVAALVAEYDASVTVFVDDLTGNHESVARHAPAVHRLHLVAEPELAPTVPTSPAAHARIDDWREAERWIADRFAAGLPAAITEDAA
jgi:hypothetical protein